MWNFVGDIQERGSKCQMGRRTQLDMEERSVCLFPTLLSDSRGFSNSFSHVVTPSPLEHLSTSSLIKKCNANFDLVPFVWMRSHYLRTSLWSFTQGTCLEHLLVWLHASFFLKCIWLVFNFGQKLLLLKAVFQLLYYLLHKGCWRAFLTPLCWDFLLSHVFVIPVHHEPSVSPRSQNDEATICQWRALVTMNLNFLKWRIIFYFITFNYCEF